MRSLTSRGARRRRGLAAVATSAAVALVFAGCAPAAPPPEPEETATGTDAGSTTLALERMPAPEGALSPELSAQLETALGAVMSEFGVPGAVAGVWVPGQGSWTTALGTADIEAGTPTSTEMSWPLRSVTKSYTVTLLLQLVDEGRVSLDDTIDQYVDGVTNGDQITLRQLAGMASGNADYINQAFVDVFEQDPNQIFALDELNGFMLGLPEQFAPGSRKVYTNANTNLLGAVVESVTGQDFAEVVQTRLIDQLEQTGTQYNLDVTLWDEPHPQGYIADESGTPVAQDQNLSMFGPAGAMTTTLDDARVWATILAAGAALTPETQAERQDGAPLEVGPPYDQYGLGIGETNGWWGHNGEGLGFTVAVFSHPETGASIVVFMNLSNVPGAHPADQAFRSLAAVLADAGF